MIHVSTRAFDLRVAAPFGISRWTHSEFERFVVELREGGLVGHRRGGANARFGEEREPGEELLAGLAPEIAEAGGAGGDRGVLRPAGGTGGGRPALRAGLSAAAWDLAGKRPASRCGACSGCSGRPCSPPSPSPSGRRRRWSRGRGRRRRVGPQGQARLRRRSGGGAQSLARELPEEESATTSTRAGRKSGRWRRSSVLAALGADSWSSRLPAAARGDGLAARARRPCRSSPTRRCSRSMTSRPWRTLRRRRDQGGEGGRHRQRPSPCVSACTGRGLRLLLGSMIESSLGIAAGLQLAGIAELRRPRRRAAACGGPVQRRRRSTGTAQRLARAGSGSAARRG